MNNAKSVQRIAAFTVVAAVWIFAGAVGVWIGLDLGRAIYG